MALMDRHGVAVTLDRIASYLELKGENPFRVRAFRTAEKTIEGFPGELDEAIADGSLAEAKGIGPVLLDDQVGIDHIAPALAHLVRAGMNADTLVLLEYKRVSLLDHLIG